jgi:transposase
MQGKKNYAEKLFNHFQLSDRVPEDNFYRILKDSLGLRYLYKATKEYYGEEGQQSIDPVVFFKLILVGYLENLNSDRKIISHSKLRLDILYFIGYDIDEELPWHSTLSRTRQLFGEEVFRDLFKAVLKLCVEKGMVSGKRQAMDSAYIKANASMDSIAEKPVLSEVEAEVMEDAEYFADELNENDESKSTVSSHKKKEVELHHKWKEEEYKEQPGHRTKKDAERDENGNLIRPKFLSNHTHYSTTDPDARISVKPGKPRQMNYSAQVSVDTKAHVITNMMADFSDKRDSQSLPKLVEQTKNNLEENHLELQEVLADTGYSSGTALRYLKENNITGYIPNVGQYKNTREGFIYNPEKNQYECQRGNKAILPFRRFGKSHDHYERKQYWSSSKDCRTCPLRSSCIGKSDFKKIDDSVDKPFYDEMHQRLQTAKAKRMKKLRSSTVEPVLGTLINFTGMRRIWTRGIAGARKFMLMAAVAYNLKKWMKFKKRERISACSRLEIPRKLTKRDKFSTFFVNTALSLAIFREHFPPLWHTP